MVKGYSRAQISLHWAVALLILFQLIFSDGMSEVWETFSDTGVATATTAAWAHIIGGLLVLAFAIWRLVLRFSRGVPGAPAGESALMKLAGEAGHWALYALMLAMPITGMMTWFGGFTDLAEVHGEILKLLLILLIVIHIVAALYHQFFLKDNLLNRMRKPLD